MRFAVVGGAGFFVNEAALTLAHNYLHAGPNAAWLIAFVPAVTFTWLGNRYLTFADKASDGHLGMLTEWARFVVANGIGAVANFVVYNLLVRFTPFPLNNLNVALAIGILVGLVFNFTLSKRLVFRGGA